MVVVWEFFPSTVVIMIMIMMIINKDLSVPISSIVRIQDDDYVVVNLTNRMFGSKKNRYSQRI